jgi:hypothetical protein
MTSATSIPPWRPFRGAAAEAPRKQEVPDWNGDLRPWRQYKRRVGIWLEATNTDSDKGGPRLLSRLSGDAWEATEQIDMNRLKAEGPTYLLQYLEQALEVEEVHLIGRSMEE